MITPRSADVQRLLQMRQSKRIDESLTGVARYQKIKVILARIPRRILLAWTLPVARRMASVTPLC